jgi:hypothetical protein
MDRPTDTYQPSVFESELHLGISHNDLLPDDVQHEIQKKLSDVERHLASLEATNASSLDSTINDHDTDHSEPDLTLRIQSYRTATALHRKLPSDVLLEMLFCCTPIHIAAGPYLPGSHAEPYNLMRVCSKWRQLVL